MSPGVVAETDLAGTLKSEYVFFDGERVARRDGATGSDGVFYYFSDHLKTASVVTDAAGNIKTESDYYPWGGELQFVANDSNHCKFTGKERGSETGLDYFGARYYSNGLGRWVSADWSATPVPVPYANFGDPQSLNLYRYPSNPETFTDPDGHCDWCQRLKNAISGDGWNTDAELTEKHRQQMIKDIKNDAVREQIKKMKPEEVNNLWDCAHNPECAAKTLAAQAAAMKPVNLPAYKDVKIDMDHIKSGHTEGGNRVSPRKDLFPKSMSDKAIESAIREAYKNGSKLATQGERVLVEGKSGSLTIQMWVNKATQTIETAWPK
jgi:RHS repeat-associated protein